MSNFESIMFKSARPLPAACFNSSIQLTDTIAVKYIYLTCIHPDCWIKCEPQLCYRGPFPESSLVQISSWGWKDNVGQIDYRATLSVPILTVTFFVKSYLSMVFRRYTATVSSTSRARGSCGELELLSGFGRYRTLRNFAFISCRLFNVERNASWKGALMDYHHGM